MASTGKQTRTILRLEEIADRMSLPVSTLRFWRLNGGGPPMFRLGRRVVGYADEVDAWVIARRDDGPDDAA